MKFADQRRACELRIEPSHALAARARDEVIPDDDAYRLTEELVPTAERGGLIKSSKVGLGCSGVDYNEYEHVMIAVATRCTEKKSGTYSVNIRWKDTACEPIDRKESASNATGSPE